LEHPILATVLYPVLKLLSDITQKIGSIPPALAISIKEVDHSLGLLERLDQSVQKNPIKTTVTKFDAILNDARRRCSSLAPVWSDTRNIRGECLCDIEQCDGISRAKPLA
jgi:hypothetical protein